MEVSLQVYLLNDDMSPAPFPAADSQITLGAFTYDAKRMGGAPSISATIMHPLCLDNYWTPNTFVEFKGERYFLKQVPTSSYSDADNVYKHESVTFVSERSILDAVYFYDVVAEDVTNDKPVSNSSNVVFFGDIHEFAARLNYSLQYAGVDYSVVVDDGITTEGKLMSFVDQFFSNVLQEIYNTYEVPYYFVGKVIHIGFTSNAIPTVFQYGVDDALLSVKKANANAKIVNRCTGIGSSENIPYYYPNPTAKGWISAKAAEGNSKLTTANIQIVNAEKFARALTEGEYIAYTEKGYGLELGDTSYSADSPAVEITDKGDGEILVAIPYQHIEPYVLEARGVITTRIPFELTEVGDFKLTFSILNYGGAGGYQNIAPPELLPNAQVIDVTTGETVQVENPIDRDDNLLSSTYSFSREYAAGSYELAIMTTFADTMFWNDHGELPYASFHVTYAVSIETPTTKSWYKANTGSRVNLEQIGIEITGDYTDGDAFTLLVDAYINPQTNLMPAVYRESDGAERFYNAINGTYLQPDSDAYYHFNNPYIEGKPKEHIVSFEDIKPTLVGMTNAAGERIDMFTEFAFDVDDNDEVDDEGNYQHPYFFGKLRKFDGEHGFNLFEHAIEDGEMTISMTSGSCGACQFVIGVADMEDGTQQNPVQVDDNGNLLYDENGNVRCGRENAQGPETPQPRQNDTRNYEVWVALQKDDQTFGVLMPNAANRYRPTAGDTFVILNINLPQAYIDAAETRLKEAIIKYMSENNDEKFKFSISFSRIYLAEHPDIYALLDENARIKVAYNGNTYDLYVSSYSYKTNDTDILPEISVELTDTLTIGQNALQTAINQVKGDFTQQVKQLDVMPSLNGKFIRKDVDDVAIGHLTFQQGLRSEAPIKVADEVSSTDASKGYKGFSIYKDAEGNWHIDADYLNIRRKLSAKAVEIQKTYHIGGAQIKSSAAMVCSSVIETDEGYLCYMDTTAEDGTTVSHGFVAGDQAYMQTFNLVKDADGNYANRFYWRRVEATSSNSILLSKTACAAGSGVPMAGDNIVQLGYQGAAEWPDRQVAVIDAGAGEDAPYYRQYVGINSFVLPEPETQLQPNHNILTGEVHIKAGSTGARNLTDLPEIIDEAMGEIDFDSMEFGKYNLLRNSGFTGDYLSKQLDPSANISDDTQLFSPSLEHWTTANATAQESDTSESGIEVVLVGGSLSQTLKSKIIRRENYVISFRAKGTSLTVSVAGVERTIALTNEYTRYVEKIVASSTDNVFAITNADCTICEIQFERGSVVSAWGYSMWDNTSELAYYQALRYLSGALKDGSTTINGGLILSNILALGNYLNGKMEGVTAGVSGVYNDADDIAFWGGGSIEQAILAVSKFRDNPQYQPTEEEWAQMAKFAVTHGGDVFMRGYIHALGGYFRGTVDIADQKILLNADGSGHFANGNVRWDSAGRVQKSAPDSVIWTRVSAYDDNAIIDYTKGSYIVLSYDSNDYEAGEAVDRYTLAAPAFSNFSIFLRNDTYDGGNMPAYLTGNFKATKNGTTVEAQGLGITTSSDNANIMVELVYESDGYWHLQSEDFTFASGSSLIEVGAAKSESFFNGYFTNVDDEGNTLNFRVIDGRLKLLS